MHTVKVSHLVKRFGDVQAVADVSFTVEPGEIFGLLGPNGAGKTTTIRMMMDIFRPDSGEVTVFGGKLYLAKKRGRNRIEYPGSPDISTKARIRGSSPASTPPKVAP